MKKAATATDYAADFAAFWAAYPRRIGKLAAEKAYAKVRRGGIPHEELMDGIAQYIATKPPYADYCHPQTWLNQGRWMDETPVPVNVTRTRCEHEPRCPTTWAHGKVLEAEATGDPEFVAAVRRLYAKQGHA